MTFPILIAGILMAALIFGATLYSTLQAIRAPKPLRFAHITLCIGVIAGMASLQFLSPPLARAAGLILLVAAIVAIFKEQGSSKLLPAIQFLFGILLASGLPFAA